MSVYDRYQDMYLNDKQYLDLLKRIRADLDKIKEIELDDCNVTGMKHTESNIGLCADKAYTTVDTAMWPKDFLTIGKVKYPYPQQTTMKYRKDYHRCPLDRREHPSIQGCFYTCLAFKPKSGEQPLMLGRVKELYDKQINRVESNQPRKGGRR